MLRQFGCDSRTNCGFEKLGNIYVRKWYVRNEISFRGYLNEMTAIPNYQIVLARSRDIHLLADIELAAVKLLEGYAPASVQVEISRQQDLKAAQAHGRLWVALSRDVPVGFAHVIILEGGLPHLEELDVHPNHSRRGLGRRLVENVCKWVKEEGHESLTLTTFREPRFNMPFYRKLGFAEHPREALTAELRTIVAHETSRGLDPEKRVVMIWRPLQALDG